MNLADLLLRIARGENLHTEFKRWPVASKDLAAELVALANTDGGQVLLGVSDAGEILGIAGVLDEALQFVDNVAATCSPSVTVLQETVDSQGRVAVVVSVPQGDARPYRTSDGHYYIRTTSGRRDASQAELRRLFQRAGSLYYDETAISESTIDDLDTDAVETFLLGTTREDYSGRPLQPVLTNLHLADDGHATVAGLVLFGREVHRFLPQATATMARLAGADLRDVTDQKDCRGRARELLDCVEAFLKTHLPEAHEVVDFGDERRPEIPTAALREAVVNAIAHRDYTIAGPIRIFVFDDRVEVRSPGILPNTVSVEAIRIGGAHVVRNPTIYTILARLGLVTGIGSGVQRMVNLVREQSGAEVLLEQVNEEFVVTLPRSSAR